MNRRVEIRDASRVDALRVAPRATTGFCDWCGSAIPARARRDSICCSVRCRQARHRFRSALGPAVVPAGRTRWLRLAYADPPYPGLAARYYRDHPDYAGEVDHDALIRRLSTYDGWALSTSAEALPVVLASCPPGVRVAAWFRGGRHNDRSARPINAWEPVIYSGGRVFPAGIDASRGDPGRVLERGRDAPSPAGVRFDALVAVSRPRTTDPARVIGAKPPAFSRWVFDLLGALPGDELHDLFPGSGGVQRAWEVFSRRVSIEDA